MLYRLPNLVVLVTMVAVARCQFNTWEFDIEKDHALVGNVIKSVPLFKAGCMLKCQETLACFSINIYKDQNGGHMCDLNRSTKGKSRPGSFQYKQGYDYAEPRKNKFCSKEDCTASKKALPNKWYQLGSSAFKLYNSTKTWEDANAACNADEASLASIASELENRFVAEVLLSQLQEHKIENIALNPYKHWKLNGPEQDVVLQGDAIYDQVNSALNLPGLAGAYATTPAFDIKTMSFTIAVWLRVESCLNKIYYIYSYWSSPLLFCFKLKWTSGSCLLSFRARAKICQCEMVNVKSSQKFLDNKWTHVAVTWDRANKKLILYQDGVQVGNQLVTNADVDLLSPTRSVFDIGWKRNVGAGGGTIKAKLKDLVVFSRSLTGQEVRLLKGTTGFEGDVKAWIGPPTASYNNWVPVLRSSSQCIVIDGRQNQWDKHHCNDMNKFICKKPV